ncbi:unnamed protein product [Spirodela intermedia]|uniref:Uncharacterized protein n=1 Tax=Spirodela intermedia TaxID=51605 RepID=A0A7I8J1D7_SPIIN|nr:unnamed protein product [Spirodela intermedia]CAA6663869.1 unnamed protein product [Spirodela intermedia]
MQPLPETKMPSGSKIERRSSVEREPKTLTTQELQCAREAAIQILRTNTLEEAVRIFMEGRKPVLRPGQRERTVAPAEALDDVLLPVNRKRSHPLLSRAKYNVSSPF